LKILFGKGINLLICLTLLVSLAFPTSITANASTLPLTLAISEITPVYTNSSSDIVLGAQWDIDGIKINGADVISYSEYSTYDSTSGGSGSSEEGDFADDRVIVRVSGSAFQPFSATSSNEFFGVEIDGIDDLMTLKPQYNPSYGIKSL